MAHGLHIVLRYKQIKATLVSVITLIFPIYLLAVIFPLLLRATDRTPVLTAGEGIARTAGIACCRGVGHIRNSAMTGRTEPIRI